MEVFSLQQQLQDAGSITCAMREAIVHLTGVYDEWDRRQNKMLKELALKRSILDCVSSGVSVSDATVPEMPLLFVNRAFERMTGYAKQEALGKNCRFLQGADTDRDTIAAIRSAIRERREVVVSMKNYRKDGSLFWNELSLSPIFADNGELTHYVGIQCDISERVDLERKLEQLAHHDSLTGLPNRAVMLDRLSIMLDEARVSGRQVAVLFLDLDGFKPINDTFGHTAGDTVLQTIAGRMKAIARHDDCVARIGGDEFVLIASDFTLPNTPAQLRQRLLAHIEQPILLAEGHTCVPRVSAGLAVFPLDGNSCRDLLHAADLAMYAKKRSRALILAPSLTLV